MKVKITMNMNDKNIFSTDSFQLAAFLLGESIPLLNADKSNQKRVIFIFEDSELREKLTQDFFTYKARVEPHRYFSAQKDLKQIIYA